MAKAAAKKQAPPKAPPKKAKPAKLTDEEQVKQYMDELKHPLKKEMEAVRQIIRNTDKKIAERIKWKAPSYYYKEDMVTFNGWAKDNVHLVFHHPAIVNIKSALLEGDYPGRRMVYFTSMKEVQAKKKELEKVIRQLIKQIDNK